MGVAEINAFTLHSLRSRQRKRIKTVYFLSLRLCHPTPFPRGSASDDSCCGRSSVSIARRSVNAVHNDPSGSLLARRCRRWLVNISASKRLMSTAFILLVGVESARIEAAAPRLTVAGSKKYFFPVAILTKSERSSSCASSNVPSSAGCGLYRPAGFSPLICRRDRETWGC